jgi:hypothetical protein
MSETIPEPIKVCINIPSDMSAEAQRLAIEENPENAVPAFDALPESVEESARLRLALITAKKWKPGRTLRVRFLDGDPIVHRKIEAYAHQWSQPEQIVEYYQARFQIEFIFRDAKQFTGLSDCQARHLPRLDFNFNASLIALNLAKYQLSSCPSSAKSFVFSICSYKRLGFNKHLLCTFIDKLDLDPDLILNHPNLPSVLSYGTLAA